MLLSSLRSIGAVSQSLLVPAVAAAFSSLAGKRVMVALGGNAMKRPKEVGTAEEMFANIHVAAEQLADMVQDGALLTVTHGNGPQVGSIYLQNQLSADTIPPFDLTLCVAESEGLLGYMLQQSLQNSLAGHGLPPSVLSIVTQIVVDLHDPAFQNPSKPIGSFYTEEDARVMIEEHGKVMKEDAGRGWRVVVPSPHPQRVVEADAIRSLADDGVTVIAGGGGGIPVVVDEKGELHGREAVVDKDFAAVLIAEVVDADALMLLTDVEFAYTNFRDPEKRTRLERVTVSEAKAMCAGGEFGAGSMLPKIEACCEFVEDTGREAIITDLHTARNALHGKSGTRIVAD